MIEPSYTAADAILHTAAVVEQMQNELARVRDAAPDSVTAREFADYAIAYIDRVRRGIAEHQVVFGAHGERYTSEIPVSTTVELGGGGTGGRRLGIRRRRIRSTDPARSWRGSRCLTGRWAL